MKTRITWWKDGGHFIGCLDEYPDYQTQGESLEDLKAHLLDLYKDLSTDAVPGVIHHEELVIA
ncbi:MAG: type II toxin-antitoxin system HicB family antitoxin [Verrucomicrobiaceae bacterium]|nr:MAG: type II toxin-antitoxin system HicB family antitoxin [Verrucomicrobiaceae bacterium]